MTYGLCQRSLTARKWVPGRPFSMVDTVTLWQVALSTLIFPSEYPFNNAPYYISFAYHRCDIDTDIDIDIDIFVNCNWVDTRWQ
jgi:hypothetical protein